MISETARYHGSFFSLLFENHDNNITIRRLSELGVGYYVIGDIAPVYLKFSTKRRGPWGFNFFRSHQENQKTLFYKYGECFTCLICGRDGVVGLSMAQLRQLLDDEFEEQETVYVRRRLNGMYQLRGRNGSLSNRISRHSVFDSIFLVLERSQ